MCAILLVVPGGAAGVGCTTYTGVEGDERPDSRTTLPDATKPSSDGPSTDTTAPPADTGGNNDTGGSLDSSVVDVPRDTAADVLAPPDGTTRDGGNDVSVDAADAADVAPPDVDIDAGGAADADATMPPGPDVTTDVVDAGPRDADATAPPPDADGGTAIDVRDSGPTCWGTPSTHDEDNDGLVDECDNCPTVANANQADVGEVNNGGTADGVGDACDPRPALGGDSIFFFDGINFTSIPASWTNVGAGSWTASGTSLSPTGTVSGQELERSFPSALGNYMAETAFTFTALTATGSASIPFRTDASRNGWGCAVGISAGSGQLFLTQVTGGTGETTPQILTIGAPQVGDRYRLLGGAYSTNVYCMLSTGERIPPRTTTGSTSGESGFRASGTSATFEYLLVYRLGGAVP